MSREDEFTSEQLEAVRAGRQKGTQTRIDRAILKQLKKGSTATNESVKRWLLKELHWKYICSVCGLVDWQGAQLQLELDHIDGDSSNNEPSNLRFLCPNCHSQTDSFRGRNLNKGRKKVSDEELKKALSESPSVRAALVRVGLAPKGANYSRAYKLLAFRDQIVE